MSDGGAVGPLAATRLGEAAFVVVLAGPGAPVAEVVRVQTQLLATQAGYSDEQKNELMQTGDAMFKVLLTEKDDQKAIEQLREIAKKATVKSLTANWSHSLRINPCRSEIDHNFFTGCLGLSAECRAKKCARGAHASS